ncbi:hypothetical protein PF010_g20098 [Phytophthora fragariae]|uniref:Uncharacterized protein n=1 Tax=Phytophthora fragariae TaxID=53985 RepID=A0A6G0KG49_9STRA|nr:hypothetical protein PF010_g20098 [Phytophthora fragariae]
MKFFLSCTTLVSAFMLLFSTTRVNAECCDVHIVFARGSGELPGLGICGGPLVKGITSNLEGMSV